MKIINENYSTINHKISQKLNKNRKTLDEIKKTSKNNKIYVKKPKKVNKRLKF